ncbi:MAG: YitT family protein [Clostridia bacterium]|nr:YitT family protein [Clostridia bacterium]
MKLKLNPEVKNTLLILVGLLCCSAAYNLYLIPNNIAAGGFTGIGQLVNSFADVSVGTVSMLLNIPLFLFSMKSLGLRFGIRSLLAMLGLSLFIDCIPFPVATNDMLLATVFGGALGGLGFGLILRGSATTGGSDMLASLIHRHIPAVRVSVGIFAVDGLVILASAFVFDQTAAMYALICKFLMNVVVDVVLEGPDSAHSYFVISDHADEIARRVMDELERGATALDAKGMYSGKEKQVLLCVVNRLETMTLRRIIFSIDPNAFVIANKAHEVLGEGFKERL